MTRHFHRAIAMLIIVLGMAGSSGTTAAGIGQACGGFFDLTCDAGMWCQNPKGQCNTPDVMGKCARHFTVCSNIIRPVCGCGARTYKNDCLRQYARAQLDYTGICRKH